MQTNQGPVWALSSYKPDDVQARESHDLNTDVGGFKQLRATTSLPLSISVYT